MATSTVYLLKNCKVTPDKNLIVDDFFSTYVWTLQNLSYSDYQYIKIEKNISLKFSVAQSYVDSTDSNFNYNYIVINQDSKFYGYFIVGRNWKSANTVEYECELDVLNTFNGAYSFSAKTNIIRQHKDRYSNKITNTQILSLSSTDLVWSLVAGSYRGIGTFTLTDYYENPAVTATCSVGTISAIYDGDGNVSITANTGGSIYPSTWAGTVAINETFLVRNIDLVPENVNPVLYKHEVGDIVQQGFNKDWYLVYRNHTTDTDSAVDCFICANESIGLNFGTGNRIYPTSLESGPVYALMRFANSQDYNVIDNNNNTWTISDSGQQYAVLKRVGNKIKWARVTFDNPDPTPTQWIECEYLQTTISANGRKTNLWPLNNSEWRNNSYAETIALTVASTVINLSALKDIDRTDSKLIKIIKLPYCPTNYLTFDGTNYSYDTTKFEYDTGMNMLELKDLSIAFGNEINDDTNDSPFKVIYYSKTPSISDTRNDNNESKLFNSEFYSPKFIYDSFNFNFSLERLTTLPSLGANFKTNFTPTSTINSKFLFKFPQYLIDGRSTQDYDNILCISRNNEETLYNSAYINYIKNGYNYDIKNKNRQTTLNAIKTAGSLVGSVVALAIPGAQGIGAALAISQGISVVNSLASTISSANQAEQDLEEKVNNAQNQAVSVSGADDVDLLTIYSNNRAKLVNYQCSNNIKTLVGDLFHYCGYAVNNRGIPNTTSRKWFNYIQCEPVFDTFNISEEFKGDLINRYAAGVTVLHKVLNDYDWSQTNENWELSILQ